MSKKIKDTDYLFITALIRARESKLLTKDRAERMIDAKTADEAAKILEECGYGNVAGATMNTLEKSLSSKRENVMEELSSLVPDKALIDIFKLKYDYHNAKVLIKAEASGADADGLMSGSGRISANALADAFYKNETDTLPEVFAEAIADAKDTLARTGDPQLSDFILDRAYFSEFSEFAENWGSRFFSGYCRLMIDSANLRAAVRSLRMGRDAAFLRKALVDGGNLKPEKFILAFDEKTPFAELFVDSPLAEAARYGDKAVNDGKLTEFEKLCDNALIAYLRGAKSVSFGEAVLISYVCSVENECSAARIIMTGKFAGLSPEAIRERLRDFYV